MKDVEGKLIQNFEVGIKGNYKITYVHLLKQNVYQKLKIKNNGFSFNKIKFLYRYQFKQ